MVEYSTADIRKFIVGHFSDQELQSFCYDYFRDAYEEFGEGMPKTEKVQRLIESCVRREALPNLMNALARERSLPYREQFAGPAAEASPVQLTTPAEPARTAHRRYAQQVFISYAYEDSQLAHRLANDLKEQGWQPWIAPESIRPGEKWAEAINRGLEECGAFVVALTPAAVHSNWVVTETNAAIELQQQGEIGFFPVVLEDCDVPVLWSVYQSISLRKGYSIGLNALLAALESNRLSLPKPDPRVFERPRVPHPTGLSRLFAAARYHRRLTAVAVATTVLVVFALAVLFLVLEMGQRTRSADCPPTIGQRVHIPTGINVWSEPAVTHGGISRTFTRRTAVYVIGGRKWGVIVYDSDVSGWWWEVGEKADGTSLGWVWEGQIEECQ